VAFGGGGWIGVAVAVRVVALTMPLAEQRCELVCEASATLARPRLGERVPAGAGRLHQLKRSQALQQPADS
jgi:hypothetical protein